MQTKTQDQYFRDWEDEAFGYGYGTGEPVVLTALKKFAELTTNDNYPDQFIYDYEVMEKELGPTVTWLLINALCKDGAIDYGSSPRYGWFMGPGALLITYLREHTVDQMYDTLTSEGINEGYYACSKNFCNCGPESTNEACKNNPFWNEHVVQAATPGLSV
jgi:hypothetical protein